MNELTQLNTGLKCNLKSNLKSNLKCGLKSKSSLNSNTSFGLSPLQIGEQIELYTIIKNNRICVTKRSRIGVDGFVCPRFMREISLLKKLMKPPKKLLNHPGRNNIVQILDVYELDGYLHFDMECADGTLEELSMNFDLGIVREQILFDSSNALQYVHEMGFNHLDISLSNIAYVKTRCDDDNNMYQSSRHQSSTHQSSTHQSNTHQSNTHQSSTHQSNTHQSSTHQSDTQRSITELKMMSTDNMFKFILIDFGNACQKTRQFTLDVSTIYSIPLECIESFDILKKINHLIHNYDYMKMHEGNDTKHDRKNEMNELMRKLKTLMIHRKSDIWSLGALSYYLHNYKMYADGETIEEHKNNIHMRDDEFKNRNESDRNEFDRNKSDKNTHTTNDKYSIIAKTNAMLISDNTQRPITYFTENIYDVDTNDDVSVDLDQKTELKISKSIVGNLRSNMKMVGPEVRSESRSDVRSETRSETSPESRSEIISEIRPEIIHRGILKVQSRVIKELITDVSVVNGKRFIFEMTEVIDDVVDHSCRIENKIIEKVVTNIRSTMTTKIKCCMINFIQIVRVTIVWLVSHLYSNHVWTFRDISNYLSHKKSIETLSTAKMNVIKIIKNIAINILESVDWNLE
jgi:serine/threonine protein kinase